jgi:phospholipid transport system substrate-binding protein
MQRAAFRMTYAELPGDTTPQCLGRTLLAMSPIGISRVFAALSFALAASLVPAEDLAPDLLMKQVSDDVIAAITQDKDIRAGDSAKIAALIELKILPHFDFKRITQLAMGAGWRQASAEQRDLLMREFQTLLVRTYSGALASYSGQRIEFSPLRSKPGDTEVTVRSRVKQPGAEPIVIEYDMEKSAAGWKVFDVRISGISLIATYRTAFAEEVRNHGVDGLIALLTSKNHLIKGDSS